MTEADQDHIVSERHASLSKALMEYDLNRPEGSFPKTRKEYWDDIAP